MFKLRSFMQGRYGIDPLNIALIAVGCIVTFLLSVFARPATRLLGLIPYLLMLFRALSTNIDGRQKENEAFMKLWIPGLRFFTLHLRRIKDKEHRYFKCPSCKRVLRVPKHKGKIEINCPFCGKKFKKKT